MARGHSPLRSALAGRGLPHRRDPAPVVAPADMEEARATAVSRMTDFLADYSMTPGAEVRLELADATDDPEELDRLLVGYASTVSRLLGYEYSSASTSNYVLCKASSCRSHDRIVRGAGILGPGGHNDWYHPECLPAGAEVGFNVYADGADPVQWLMQAWAELDAGRVRPGAHPMLKRIMSLRHGA